MGASKKTRKGSSQATPPPVRGGRSPNVRNKTSQKRTTSQSPETSPTVGTVPRALKEDVNITRKVDASKEDEATPQETPVKKTKKGANSSDATPMSPVRRSSRAPVPSSRFKDMEMGASNRKRSLASSLSEESDGDVEPSSKRSKKTSERVVKSTFKGEDKSDTLKEEPEERLERLLIALSESISEEQIQEPEKIGEICIQKDAETEIKGERIETDAEIPAKEEPIENDALDAELGGNREELTEENAPPATTENNEEIIENDTQDEETKTKERMENDAQHAGTENKEERTENDANTVNEEAMTVSVTTSKEQVEAASESASVEGPTEVVISPLVTTKTTEEQDNIDESKTLEANSSVSAGMVVEETVHTFMDEKDVIVVKKSQDRLKSSPPVISSLTIDGGEVKTQSGTAEIIIKGQEITLQEKDGQTVAIIKVPSNFVSDHSIPTVIDKPLVSNASNEKNSPVGAKTATRKKSRHGYILHKSVDEPSLVLAGQDSASVVNVALDHNAMKSVLKPKTESPASKPPVITYGRVLKQESSMNAMVINSSQQTSLLDTHANSSNIVIQNVGSTQPYSLLPQTIKAVSQTEGKTYSLLAPPTELKQMLKGVNEKKFAGKGNTSSDSVKHPDVSSPSQKVIIISPSSTSDRGVETTETVANPSIASGSETLASDVGMDQDTLKKILLMADTSVSPSLATTENRETDDACVEEVVGCENLTVKSTVEEISDKSKFLLNDAEEKGEGSDPLVSDTKSSETVIIQSGISNEKNAPDLLGNENHDEMPKNTELVDDEKKEQGLMEDGEHLKVVTAESEETKRDITDSSGDKLPLEEVVVTSSDGTTVLKVEGQDEDISSPSASILSTALAEVEKTQNSGTLKPQRIKLIENGVVYEFQVFPEVEGKASQELKEDETVVVKQEVTDAGDAIDSPTVDQDVTKFSSGTQTFYSNKKGRPKSSDDSDETEPPVHKLATIVQEGDQRKHYYYVSVVPGKTLVGKYRHSVDPSLPGCMVNKLGEYCCKECNYKTDRKANFYKHRRLHTGTKPHLCPVCKYQARTSSNLKRHMGIHDDIREFKCTQCSMSFRQKIHLERHVRYRHEEKRVKCPMCDYVCANEQPDLKMHIKRKHTQESGKTFSCPECKLVVGSRRDLKQHLKFHKDGPELKLFCKECSFVTDCKSRLQRHLVVHSNVKPFQCGVCDYKATQKEHVLRHLRSQHKIEVNKPKRPWKKQCKSETPDSAQGNPKGDFTCGDKIFACNHCIMRFAKLINLYKHLHTQHSDIMPVETEGNYYCVVCEFSTSSKKNLLVHMRRHNMTDQTPPTHVYSCVLCRYVNPRRRNLFQHMRKKHNIDISSQVDIAGMKEEEVNAVQEGVKVTELIQTEEGVYTQGSSGDVSNTPVEGADGNVRVVGGDLAAVANMIKIEDLTRTQVSENENGEDHSLVIDSTATGEGSIPIIHASNLMQHKAADAIEGLQALAGQAGFIIEEEVQGTEKQQTIVIEQQDGEVLSTTSTTLPDGSIVISADQGIVGEQIAIDSTTTEQISQIVESEETLEVGSGLTSLELTEEQLSSLQHGDMIQIEGQVYLVELTQDPDSPDKQLLSFIPVTQA